MEVPSIHSVPIWAYADLRYSMRFPNYQHPLWISDFPRHLTAAAPGCVPPYKYRCPSLVPSLVPCCTRCPIHWQPHNIQSSDKERSDNSRPSCTRINRSLCIVSADIGKDTRLNLSTIGCNQSTLARLKISSRGSQSLGVSLIPLRFSRGCRVRCKSRDFKWSSMCGIGFAWCLSQDFSYSSEISAILDTWQTVKTSNELH